jgi:hypothetical protein
MSRNWRWETASERAAKVVIAFAAGFAFGAMVFWSKPAHAQKPQPLTIVVCAQQAASFRYEGGVMYVTCPPDNKPVLTVYGCVGPSLDRNKTPGPRGYEYTFKCQSWTTYVQTPKT